MSCFDRLGVVLSRGVLLGVLGFVCAVCWAEPVGDFQQQRQRLVEEISQDVSDTRAYIGKSSLDDRVMQVIGLVGRHRFVPADLQSQAYENRPLPIGYGQTISQPYIVALMTDLLEPEAGDVVLEIGTGSGYQAAVLSRLVKQVYSIEIIPELAESATGRLQRLGFANVEVKNADGYYGWQEHAPFDAIIVETSSGQRERDREAPGADRGLTAPPREKVSATPSIMRPVAITARMRNQFDRSPHIRNSPIGTSSE